MKKGFTLVELVIVIVIVGILSIVAVPIYKGYVERAQLTEGMALLGAIKTAQSVYYAEHGQWYSTTGNVQYDPVLMVDARANKYFSSFSTGADIAAGYWQASASDAAKSLGTILTYWNADLNAPKLPESGRYLWWRDGSQQRF